MPQLHNILLGYLLVANIGLLNGVFSPNGMFHVSFLFFFFFFFCCCFVFAFLLVAVL